MCKTICSWERVYLTVYNECTTQVAPLSWPWLEWLTQATPPQTATALAQAQVGKFVSLVPLPRKWSKTGRWGRPENNAMKNIALWWRAIVCHSRFSRDEVGSESVLLSVKTILECYVRLFLHRLPFHQPTHLGLCCPLWQHHLYG